MRISDWSSDVCSSDLQPSTTQLHVRGPLAPTSTSSYPRRVDATRPTRWRRYRSRSVGVQDGRNTGTEWGMMTVAPTVDTPASGGRQPGRASCREEVGQEG